MAQDMNDLRSEIIAIREGLQDVKLEAVRTQGKVEAIRISVVELESDITAISSNKVSIGSFKPVQTITYGIVGIVLISFLTALVSIVIPQMDRAVQISGIPAEVYKREAPKHNVQESGRLSTSKNSK